MAKKALVAILLACAVGIGYGQEKEKKELTEVQKLKAELVKLQIQVAVKDQQLARCTLQTLEVPAKALEAEFLKQVGAEPNAEWDWATMTVKKP